MIHREWEGKFLSAELPAAGEAAGMASMPEAGETAHGGKRSGLAVLREGVCRAGNFLFSSGSRRPVLLLTLLLGLLVWLFADLSEREAAERAAVTSAESIPSSGAAQGAEETHRVSALGDPFCLLHTRDADDLAALAALGGVREQQGNAPAAGDSAGRNAGQTGKVDISRAQSGTGGAGNGVEARPGSVADPSNAMVARGVITSNAGRVLLMSFEGQDFFLAEGEEKHGVLLHSLGEETAVVLVNGRLYTLPLPR